MKVLGKMRRLYYRDGLSFSEIARKTGYTRNTVKRWLKAPEGVEPTYRRQVGDTKITPYAAQLRGLGVRVDAHGKMPDVVIHDTARGWLILVEAVTSHGPVDGKRHDELARLFAASSAGLVFVTAFPSRALMARYVPEIAWETEVWVADAPSHLIHFNGSRFLGPYHS